MATKKRLEKEASEDYTFVYEGVEYNLPHPNKFPLDALEALEEQRIIGFVKGLIGEAKYKELRKTAKTIEDLEEFVTSVFESMDVDPKE